MAGFGMLAGWTKALEKELSELDVLIDDQIRGSAVWVEKEDLLASVPGVGKTIARTPDRRTAGTRFARPSTDRIISRLTGAPAAY
jgi:hypothetical protein